MNAETKRHIDSARQVLVGVVPNPSLQIDQITNALIYKFMDDMDQSVIKIGGKPTFFTGDLEKYAWVRIMDARMGAQERMNLYGEALIKFSQAKQLPELFREIFKQAMLPYRAPEVLDLFLKEINYFSYSHSEDLGDAFEYLLSVMSSQGDAGMFRTPRHIIEFIVDVVSPTKDDKILDPACGTAGFLISAYKHILEQHACPSEAERRRDGKDDPEKKEIPLTPEQKKKLTNNFIGYDISPEMVRLSRVNMYLHQFKEPQIIAYNTLADEERWNDKFDVILANPPFMSPKGAGKPHSKFTIQATKSEVLFVDYIMNHLRPKGRAGIIVPERIIFQSGKAHKELRKNLVNDGLYAVVSLPSGVFAPYSGVKTSILFFDNELAKQRNEILFVKIQNDGFDLGAQRRPINKNDLPTALEILNRWRTHSVIPNEVEGSLAISVPKSKIAENGDYNLSGDRYRIATDYTNAKWPMVELGELEKDEKIEFLRGQGLSKRDLSEEGKNKCVHYGEIYTLYDPIIKYVISRTDYDGKIKSVKGDVLVPATTTADAMGIAVARSLNENGVIIGGDINIIRTENKYILSDYLANLISNPPLKIELSKSAKGANILHLSNSDLRRLKIPLPPLEIQEHIVAELDGYANIIAGARLITKNWKPKIEIPARNASQGDAGGDPEWEKVKLGEVVDFVGGYAFKSEELKREKSSDIDFPVIKIGNVGRNGNVEIEDAQYFPNNKSLVKFIVNKDDIVIAMTGATVGKVAVSKFDNLLLNQRVGLVRPNEQRLSKYFLKSVLFSNEFYEYCQVTAGGGAQGNISPNQIKEFEIPLPPLAIQKQIVEKIEAERTLVDSAKKLIDIYEQKTKATIAKLWEK